MNRLTITDLDPGQCKFPITPDDAVRHYFCGEPVEYEKCPYCAFHAALCFDRRSDEVKKARAQQAAVARAARKNIQYDAGNKSRSSLERSFRDEQFGRDS